MGIVLQEFSEIGFDVEWSVVSCAEVGGVHLRERVWIIAHSQSFSRSIASTTGIGVGRGSRYEFSRKGKSDRDGVTSHANSIGHQKPLARNASRNSERNDPPCKPAGEAIIHDVVAGSAITPNSNGFQRKGQRLSTGQEWKSLSNSCGCIRRSPTPNAMQPRLETRQRGSSGSTKGGEPKRALRLSDAGEQQEDKTEPSVCRNDDGSSGWIYRPYLMTPEDLPTYLPIATDSETIPNRPERLKALGNAIVPQVAAIALQRVLELFKQAN
jgi:site-specific DNA-cytosine methylase